MKGLVVVIKCWRHGTNQDLECMLIYQ